MPYRILPLVRCHSFPHFGHGSLHVGRLGRSLKDLIEIIRRLEGDGIQFRSLTEGVV